MTGRLEFHEGDNRDILRRMIDRGEFVHSVVTDPPYGLVSTVKRFGKDGAAKAGFGRDGAYSRASAGFMNQSWDGTQIERDPEFWRLIHDVLLPGGYVMAFSSPRTGHWQACAMETAGFIMHPFLGWLYGQGFPKAHNAAMAIDKQLGATGSRGEPKPGHAEFLGRSGELRSLAETGVLSAEGGFSRPWMNDPAAVAAYHLSYVPGSPEAQAWEGWHYGGQALKPALEPIYVGQRPFSEKNGALNILKHWVGAINVDGCRVSVDPLADANQLRTMARSQRVQESNGQSWGMSTGSGDVPTVVRPDGRWPANLIHDGSPEVVALFPQSAGQLAKASSSDTRKNQNVYNDMARGSGGSDPRNDAGSAARFFNAFPADEECSGFVLDLQNPLPHIATHEHAVCPTCNDANAFGDYEGPMCEMCGGEGILHFDPVFYQGKATKVDRAGSAHPTVKPIALMRWLCRLVTPPGGTVLDPFAGSGTTGAAALAEDFSVILMEQHSGCVFQTIVGTDSTGWWA